MGEVDGKKMGSLDTQAEFVLVATLNEVTIDRSQFLRG